MNTIADTFSSGTRAQGFGVHPVFSRFALFVPCLFLLAGPLFAANHPAVTGRNANCALCHADMTQGASVHSQGELDCGLCHSSRAAGDTAQMLLTVPKEQICFVCHERSAMQQHVAATAEKDCLVCHDAHRSARAMLLRRNVGVNYAHSDPPAATPKGGIAAKIKSHVPARRHLPPHPEPTDHKL